MKIDCKDTLKEAKTDIAKALHKEYKEQGYTSYQIQRNKISIPNFSAEAHSRLVRLSKGHTDVVITLEKLFALAFFLKVDIALYLKTSYEKTLDS